LGKTQVHATNYFSRIVRVSVLCLLAACGQRATQPPQTPNELQKATPPILSGVGNWVGIWWGPEGTSLEIAVTKDGYRIIVRNLDGPRVFTSVEATGDRLSFVRDGVTESIQPGTGAQTGMKWLADKSNCLVVKVGEGYCRE
jgi:hypothetical protein